MTLTTLPYFLEFIRPFELAHGARTGTELAFVRIESQGVVAFGEASLPPYYSENVDSVQSWVASQVENVSQSLQTNPFENWKSLPYSSDNPAASAAVQSAILRWYALRSEVPFSHYFKIEGGQTSLTLTLTKQDQDFLDEKLKRAADFTHLKLKLTGESDDLDFVRAVRNKTDLPICIDVNQGFKSREGAIEIIETLESMDCALVEQPLNARDHEGHYWLRQRTPVPIVADESIKNLYELEQYHDAYSGINVKLMKAGGLFQAKEMLEWDGAGDTYLKLLGCMAESSLGVATASVLAPLSAISDLDAPYLIKNDPFKGFNIHQGQVVLADRIELVKPLKKENH